jgi:TctA family transporter
MTDAIWTGLINLVGNPHTMGLMLIAVMIGIIVGATPGIGGRLSIALAIPFVFGMDMTQGAVFLLTMHAVNGTSGQISSIMFGVPGDGDDAATTIDGYPMAKKGEAGRALGASITASGVGGIIGAGVFAVMIPLLEPVVLAFSPAEFFLLAILGITFIAFLAGKGQIFKGIIVGLFGMMLATVGMDPQTGTARYAGDYLFLWDGVSIVTCVLAVARAGALLLQAIIPGRDGRAAPLVPRHPYLDHRGGDRHDSRPWRLCCGVDVLRPCGAILQNAGAFWQGRG